MGCVVLHLQASYVLLTTLRMLQEQQLTVADPLALHHILVKEQYVYEETEPFLL